MDPNFTNENVLLLSKALLIIVLGILVGFILKHIIRKIIDRGILKPVFKKDIKSYETTNKINRILTEIMQWAIIILPLNYALEMLELSILSDIVSYILKEIPHLAIAAIIIAIGVFGGKLAADKIRHLGLEKKEEVGLIIETVIIIAFILTALEFLGINATALLELYRVILYILAAMIVIFLLKPDIFGKKDPKKKR